VTVWCELSVHELTSWYSHYWYFAVDVDVLFLTITLLLLLLVAIVTAASQTVSTVATDFKIKINNKIY